MLFSLILVQAALALAVPTSKPVMDKPAELLLRYNHDTSSDRTELVLSTADKQDVYAHACDSTLNIAGKTIAVNVNGRGSGTVSVDGKEYTAAESREISGGISCAKMYTESTTVVQCSIPWSDSLDALTALSADDAESCFEDPTVTRRSIPAAFSHPFAAAIEKRFSPFGCTSRVEEKTELVGDGNPHQDVLHKQIGPSLKCPERGSCYVSTSKEDGLTITAEIGSGGGPTGWITGGFSVSRSKSVSVERGCEGDPHDTVCLWSKTQHTAYTVITTLTERCGMFGSPDVSDPYVIRSPNTDSRATEWYCVLGSNNCRGDSDHYWEMGVARGGPP